MLAALTNTLEFWLFGQVTAPHGEIGPIRTNFAPNLTNAGAAQRLDFSANGDDANLQHRRFAAFGSPGTQLGRQAICLIERLGERV